MVTKWLQFLRRRKGKRKLKRRLAMLLEKKINPMTAKRLIHEADLNSTGTPDLDLFKVLGSLPEHTIFAIDLFLSEFDYYSNKTSNRAIALRILASGVSAVLRALKIAEKGISKPCSKEVQKNVKPLPSKKKDRQVESKKA